MQRLADTKSKNSPTGGLAGLWQHTKMCACYPGVLQDVVSGLHQGAQSGSKKQVYRVIWSKTKQPTSQVWEGSRF